MGFKQDHTHGVDSPTAFSMTTAVLRDLEAKGIDFVDYLTKKISDIAESLPTKTYHIMGVRSKVPRFGTDEIDVFLEYDDGVPVPSYYVGVTLSIEKGGSQVSSCTHVVSDEKMIDISKKISTLLGIEVRPCDLRQYVINA